MADSTTIAAVATSVSGVLIAAGTTAATIISARRRAASDDAEQLAARVAEREAKNRRLETAFNELYAYAIRLWRWALPHEDLPVEFQNPPSRDYEDV